VKGASGVTSVALGGEGPVFTRAAAWLASHAVSGGAYTIALDRDETVSPNALSLPSGAALTLTTIEGTGEIELSLSGTGTMFILDGGETLTLDGSIVLRGLLDNTLSLVQVDGGLLDMRGQSRLTGNQPTPGRSIKGSGAAVLSGELRMSEGASIDGNGKASQLNSMGGGVYVKEGGRVSLSDSARVQKNNAYYGGGIYSDKGVVILGGGAAVSDNYCYNDGGGLYLLGGEFTLTGNAAIGRNQAGNYGGGLYVRGPIRLVKTGGVVYGAVDVNFNRSGNNSAAACYAATESYKRLFSKTIAIDENWPW
jgi:predicted outer membrane repeat protein